MDTLFDTIARHQGNRPWGRVLDAGTGRDSLNWLLGLDTESITAITANERDAGALRPGLRAPDSIICDNWENPELLAGEIFETVIADYLLGALDAFAPYFQSQLFSRLRPHVGHRLYVVGKEPVPAAQTSAQRLIEQTEQLRDACILLAGHRTYREYPRRAAVMLLENAAFEVERSWTFAIRYHAGDAMRQLDVARSKLPFIEAVDARLRRALERRIATIRRQLQRLGDTPIELGSDYVIVAKPAADADRGCSGPIR